MTITVTSDKGFQPSSLPLYRGRHHFMNVAEIRAYLKTVGYAYADTIDIRRTKTSTRGVRAFTAVPPNMPTSGQFVYMFQLSEAAGGALRPYVVDTTFGPASPAHLAAIDAMNELYRALFATAGVNIRARA